MSRDYKNSAFKELLDRLQQESWQLELLISGFAIFGGFRKGFLGDNSKKSQKWYNFRAGFEKRICGFTRD